MYQQKKQYVSTNIFKKIENQKKLNPEKSSYIKKEFVSNILKQPHEKIPLSHKNDNNLVSQKMFYALPVKDNVQEKVINKQKDQRKLINSLQFPYSAIGYYYCQFGDKTKGFGTAFLVGHNLAITCAHNIYSRWGQKFISCAFFTLGMNSGKHDAYQVACAYVPEQYITQKQENKKFQFDYGLLVLNTCQPLGDYYGFFSISNQEIQANEEIQICGFPLDKNFETNLKQGYPFQNAKQIKSMFGCSNKVLRLKNPRIFHNVDTQQGQSGAPILRKSLIFEENQVIGIHTGGFEQQNWGIIITQKIRQNINLWIKEFIQNGVDQSNQFKGKVKFVQKDYLQAQIFLQSLQNENQQEMIQDLPQNLLMKNNFDDADQLYQIAREQKKSDYVKSLAYLKKACKILEKNNQKQSLKYSLVLNTIGNNFNKLGKTGNALYCYEKSKQIVKKIQGNKSIEYAKRLINIGSIFLETKGFEQSQKCLQQALKILKEKEQQKSLLYAKILNNIGRNYLRQNQLEKANEALEKGLFIIMDLNGPNSIQNARFLVNMSSLYLRQQNSFLATQYLERCIEIFKINNIEYNKTYAGALSMLACIYGENEKYYQAQNLLKQSKNIYENLFGKKNINKHYLKACKRLQTISSTLQAYQSSLFFES